MHDAHTTTLKPSIKQSSIKFKKVETNRRLHCTGYALWETCALLDVTFSKCGLAFQLFQCFTFRRHHLFYLECSRIIFNAWNSLTNRRQLSNAHACFVKSVRGVWLCVTVLNALASHNALWQEMNINSQLLNRQDKHLICQNRSVH